MWYEAEEEDGTVTGRTTIAWGVLACSVVLSGCTVPKKGGFADVEGLVEARVGQRVHWSGTVSGPADVSLLQGSEGSREAP